jgi:hypothetical protein
MNPKLANNARIKCFAFFHLTLTTYIRRRTIFLCFSPALTVIFIKNSIFNYCFIFNKRDFIHSLESCQRGKQITSRRCKFFRDKKKLLIGERVGRVFNEGKKKKSSEIWANKCLTNLIVSNRRENKRSHMMSKWCNQSSIYDVPHKNILFINRQPKWDLIYFGRKIPQSL